MTKIAIFCVSILMAITASASALSQVELAQKNVGVKTGTYSISKKSCSLSVEEIAKDATYMFLFDVSNYAAGAGTYNDSAWSTDVQRGFTSYKYDYAGYAYTTHFYFDENLAIFSFKIEGDPRGNCNLN